MKHTKGTVKCYLKYKKSPSNRLEFLYGVENQLKNHSTNALKNDLHPKEKELLNWVQAEIEFIKANRKKLEIEYQKKVKNKSGSKNSNSHKVHIAKDWLPKLVKSISKIEEPTHKKILNEINKEFPDFEGIPNEPHLNFERGLNKLNKTSIDKALTYLFNKRHENNEVEEGTIKKRASKQSWW